MSDTGEESVKKCEWCLAYMMARRDEPKSSFKRRRFCGYSCAALSRNRKKTTVKDSQRMQYIPRKL